MADSIKERLRRGDPIVAVSLAGDNPDLVEPLQRFGADLAFIDCERTGIGLDAATRIIRAARACGLPSVVRSPSDDAATLVQFLDRKATGLVVPHVDTPAQAAAVVELTRYACGDDAAYRLARALNRGEAALAKRLPQASETTSANTVASAPRADLIHPGAQRYLKEAGLLR